MNRKIYLHEEYSDRAGIDIAYSVRRKSLSIGGWYDSCVGIGNYELSLSDFFLRLGITEADCIKAFKECAK